jgi:hypothetical protein
MAVNLDLALINLIITIIVNIIFISPSLWISGRLLVGAQKAKFIDALWIVILGTIISSIFGYFFQGIIASLILFVILLGLVKHFFDCGWLKALVICIIAVIIYIVITMILLLIGIGIGLLPIGNGLMKF